MSIYIFLGPSLSTQEARGVLDAIYLPPVSQGDVFRVVDNHSPRVIGIIDGYFQEVPSVWHKELLWAMSQGVHVFGSASMGALRAAELDDFGMQGVGRIYEAYRCGVLEPFHDTPFEDDDEVAVIHGPPETGYQPLSEAMVNIRCTLAAAAQAGVISASLRDSLAAIGKACFYKERTYETLHDRALLDGWADDELEPFREWLPHGRIDQKKEDALTMLTKISSRQIPEPKRVSFVFQHTTMWDRLTAEVTSEESELNGDVFTAEEEGVLEELRLVPSAYLEAKTGAEEQLQDSGIVVSGHGSQKVILAMLKFLRSNGWYANLAARAEQKNAVVGGLDQFPLPQELTGLQTLQLFDWYFESRLGRPMPDDVEAFAKSAGFTNRNVFIQALLREYTFVSSEEVTNRP